MKTEAKASTRVRQPDRNHSVAVRLVESPTHRSTRLRRQRKQEKRESKTMAAMCTVVGFLMTVAGLYVNEHAALNTREREASGYLVDNNRLRERKAAIDSEADGLLLKQSVPSPEKLAQMGMVYERAPRYLTVPTREGLR